MRRTLAISGCLLLACRARGSFADDASVPTIALPAPAPSKGDLPTNEQLSQLVETIVRESIPRTFENTKHWSKRERIPNGLDVERRGLRLRISKRERDVRHGFWRKYVVTLVEPEENLHLRIENLRSPASGEFRWDLHVSLRANVDVRFEHWHLGVKMFNSSSEADATLDVHADCSLKINIETEAESHKPVVVLRPTVHDIDLRLPDLDVHKLGTVRGPLVKELGDGLEEIIEDLLQTQEDSIRKQAQKSIDKHADELRFPLADFFSSRWSALWRSP